MSRDTEGSAIPNSEQQESPEHSPDGAQQKQATCYHDLDSETWTRVIAVASSLVAHCSSQAADRENLLQDTLLGCLQVLRGPNGVTHVFAFVHTALRYHEMKLGQASARAILTLAECDEGLPGRDLSGGSELDLHQRLAEMPRPLRRWSLLFMRMQNPAAIALHARVAISTVYWWAHRIKAWVLDSS